MKYRDADLSQLKPELLKIINSHAVKETKTIDTPEGEREIVIVTGFSKGLFLYGSTGVGKTYILHAIENRCDKRHIRTSFRNWIDLLGEFKANLDYLQNQVKTFLAPKIVILDDIGAEKQTEWSQEILYTIVNKCYEDEKALFIATNLSLEEFREKYGDRIFSRINEMCDLLEITGEDRRFQR